MRPKLKKRSFHSRLVSTLNYIRGKNGIFGLALWNRRRDRTFPTITTIAAERTYNSSFLSDDIFPTIFSFLDPISDLVRLRAVNVIFFKSITDLLLKITVVDASRQEHRDKCVGLAYLYFLRCLHVTHLSALRLQNLIVHVSMVEYLNSLEECQIIQQLETISIDCGGSSSAHVPIPHVHCTFPSLMQVVWYNTKNGWELARITTDNQCKNIYIGKHSTQATDDSQINYTLNTMPLDEIESVLRRFNLLQSNMYPLDTFAFPGVESLKEHPALWHLLQSNIKIWMIFLIEDLRQALGARFVVRIKKEPLEKYRSRWMSIPTTREACENLIFLASLVTSTDVYHVVLHHAKELDKELNYLRRTLSDEAPSWVDTLRTTMKNNQKLIRALEREDPLHPWRIRE